MICKPDQAGHSIRVAFGKSSLKLPCVHEGATMPQIRNTTRSGPHITCQRTLLWHVGHDMHAGPQKHNGCAWLRCEITCKAPHFNQPIVRSRHDSLRWLGHDDAAIDRGRMPGHCVHTFACDVENKRQQSGRTAPGPCSGSASVSVPFLHWCPFSPFPCHDFLSWKIYANVAPAQVLLITFLVAYPAFKI